MNSNKHAVLQHLPSKLKDTQSTHALPSPDKYTKTLGIEWNTTTDQFHLSISELPPIDCITKRVPVSDVAKTFDVLGWFSPTIIKVKILMQHFWELKIETNGERRGKENHNKKWNGKEKECRMELRARRLTLPLH